MTRRRATTTKVRHTTHKKTSKKASTTHTKHVHIAKIRRSHAGRFRGI